MCYSSYCGSKCRKRMQRKPSHCPHHCLDRNLARPMKAVELLDTSWAAKHPMTREGVWSAQPCDNFYILHVRWRLQRYLLGKFASSIEMANLCDLSFLPTKSIQHLRRSVVTGAVVAVTVEMPAGTGMVAPRRRFEVTLKSSNGSLKRRSFLKIQLSRRLLIGASESHETRGWSSTDCGPSLDHELRAAPDSGLNTKFRNSTRCGFPFWSPKVNHGGNIAV